MRVLTNLVFKVTLSSMILTAPAMITGRTRSDGDSLKDKEVVLPFYTSAVIEKFIDRPSLTAVPKYSTREPAAGPPMVMAPTETDPERTSGAAVTSAAPEEATPSITDLTAVSKPVTTAATTTTAVAAATTSLTATTTSAPATSTSTPARTTSTPATTTSMSTGTTSLNTVAINANAKAAAPATPASAAATAPAATTAAPIAKTMVSAAPAASAATAAKTTLSVKTAKAGAFEPADNGVVSSAAAKAAELKMVVNQAVLIYGNMKLEKQGLDEKAFEYAWRGYHNMLKKGLIHKRTVLSICDFSQSSCSKRMYVIDVLHRKLLYRTYVAHGQNSGEEYATTFSNEENSFKSSLGFYVTDRIYYGRNGLSLRLNGVDSGYNDLALKRKIVLHGSTYVGDKYMQDFGTLGTSLGCPALPSVMSGRIIKAVRNGSCLFIYHPTQQYLENSTIING